MVMAKILIIFTILFPLSVLAKVQIQKVSEEVSLPLDDSRWGYVATEKLFSHTTPLLFNKRYMDVLGAIFTSPMPETRGELGEISKKECTNPDFKSEVVSLKETRTLCDISFTRNGKTHRQLWFIDKVGSNFHKTIMSFSADEEYSSEMTKEVDELKRSIAGAKE